MRKPRNYIRTTKKAIQLALLWCYFKYGRSIWQVLPLHVAIRNNLNAYGQYKQYDVPLKNGESFDMRFILVNLKLHNHNVKDCIETAIHEYVHHLQQIDLYESYFNKGFNYDSHPFEEEAIFISKRDVDECYEWVQKRLKNDKSRSKKSRRS